MQCVRAYVFLMISKGTENERGEKQNKNRVKLNCEISRRRVVRCLHQATGLYNKLGERFFFYIIYIIFFLVFVSRLKET